MNINNKKINTKLAHPICEVRIDGKMALVSLYDDLPHFEYDQTIDKLKSSNNKLNILVQELEQHIRKTEKEHSQLKTAYGVLSKNIVSLYKTACREIKRKDIMINELRNSCSKIKPSSESNMFSSSNLLLEKTQINKLCNVKLDTLQISNHEEKSKTLNQNNSLNVTNIGVKPNHDIPKTVYYKRLCQKITKQNENILSKNNTKKCLETCSIASEKIPDKDVSLNDDQIVLKKLESPVLYNDFLPNINSTLVICEPDMPISDSEHSTTSVVQCQNSEKHKESISLTKSCSLKVKPKKCKKKFVITPASIGVLNTSNETSKCIEKLKKNKDVDFKLIPTISNSPEIKLLKDSIESTQSMLIKEYGSNVNTKIDSKHVLRTDIAHEQKLFTQKNNNEVPVNNEIQQVPFEKKTQLTEKNYPTKLTEVRKSSPVISSGPLDNNDLNTSTEYVNCSSKNTEKKFRQTVKKNKQIKCMLNDNVESSPKNTAIQTNVTDKISKLSKNNPVKVTTVKKSSPVISLDSSDDSDINTSTEYVNCSSKKTRKKSRQTEKENNQLKCLLNDNVENSPKNTAFQTNVTNKISKPSKVDPVKVTAVKKSSPVISLDSSDDSDINTSTEYVNCSSKKTRKKSRQTEKENNQLKCLLNDDVENSSKNTAIQTNITNKISKLSNVDPLKMTTVKNSTVISLSPSDKNDLNTSTEYVICSSKNTRKKPGQTEENNQLKYTLTDNVESSPKNTAVETNLTNEISTTSKNIVTEKNDTIKVTTVIKSSRVISLGFSDGNNCNMSTEYVNCSSINNEKESIQYIEENNQLTKCMLNDTIESSPKNTIDEKNLSNKLSTPFKNIETGKNGSFKVTTIRKSPQSIKCLSNSDDQCSNVAVVHMKCSSMNCENKSSYIPKQTNSYLECNVNNIRNSYNLAVETSLTNKTCIPFKNIEVDQIPTRRSAEINNFVKVASVKKSSRVVSLSSSVDNNFNTLTEDVKSPSVYTDKSSQPKEKNNQLGFKSNDVVKRSSKHISVGTNIVGDIFIPSVRYEEIRRKRRVNSFPGETVINRSSGPSVDYELKSTKKVQCLPIEQNNDSSISLKQKDNLLACKLSINNCKNDLKKLTESNDHIRSYSKSAEVDCGRTEISSTSIDLKNKLVRSNLSQDENNQEFKKGRRVQLITIQDHYSEPLPSFNGAKKTEIDVSKTSVHIEKEVESSSRFYVPQVKRRKLLNFSNTDL